MTAGPVLLDVDGTLVDSNYHHALAWSRAFADRGWPLALARIHRGIGMGGDLLVAALAGHEIERRDGDAIRERWRVRFDELIGEVRPIEGARECLEALAGARRPVALASSAEADHLEHYLDLLDARSLIGATTTAGDVRTTKPAGDIVAVAMRELGVDRAVMVGDSRWDCRAAARLGVPTIGVLSGGYCAAELREAGAVRVEPAVGAWLAEAPEAGAPAAA